MKLFKLVLIIFLSSFLNTISLAKDPQELITSIVNEASLILKSSDPVESKIIKLNDIAERNVDINGIGMYALGKHKKSMSEDEKIKYTYTRYNAGICEGVNLASKLSSTNYILYAHDDFYFCPGWDRR